MTSAISQSIPAQARRLDRATLGRVVVLVAACLVGLAGVLKIVEALSRSPGVQEQTIGIFGRFGLAIGLLECFLAVWIVLLRRERWILPAVAGLFSVFLGFAAYRWWVGYADCGCFGVVRVPPWITGLVDASMVTLATICRPSAWSPVRLTAVLLGAGAFGAGAAHLDSAASGRCIIIIEDVRALDLSQTNGVSAVLWYNSACPKCAFVESLPLPPGSVRLDTQVYGLSHRGKPQKLSDSKAACRVIVERPVMVRMKPGTLTVEAIDVVHRSEDRP